MSQNNAESSELAKLDKKFMDTDDRVTEIEVSDMSNVTTSSDSMENFSGVDKNDTVDDDEVEGPESNVFRNPVLLKLIGENADFATLKSVRSLNILCKELLTSQLTNKSRITLKAGGKPQEQLEAIKNLKGINALKIAVFNKSKFGFESEGEMFIDILEHLSPTLKVLEFDMWEYDEIPLPSPSIQFPSLSTLTIGDMDYEEKGARLFQLICASAPNLTSLILKYLSPQDILPLLLADDGTRNYSLAPNLKSLTLEELLSPKNLLPLINFPQTWESLDITGELLTDDGSKNIGRLLEKNKDTLVRLKLQQDPNWDLDGLQKLKLPPSFPKLEELELELFEEDCEVSSGSGPINYSKTFPALTSLSMYLGYKDYRPPRLWSSLFPPQVFNGLKNLKLTYAGLLHEEGIAENWAQTMFPNARVEIIFNDTKFNQLKCDFFELIF